MLVPKHARDFILVVIMLYNHHETNTRVDEKTKYQQSYHHFNHVCSYAN